MLPSYHEKVLPIDVIYNLFWHIAGEASKPKLSPSKSSSSAACSSPSSPFFQRLRHLDSEEDHGQNQNQKKSVITKVKEKAKKLRHSLSKKKHEDWNLTSPPSSAGHEGDGAEEDAEKHGATCSKKTYITCSLYSFLFVYE